MHTEDVVCGRVQVLKPGGRFYMVHRPRRFTEIIQTLMEKVRRTGAKAYEDGPPPCVDREANMVLIEAVIKQHMAAPPA